MNHLIYIKKANGERELFEESKLVESLKRIGADDKSVEDIMEQIGTEIKDGMTTSQIYSHAFDLLRKHSMPMAVRYSLRRALSELGPSGFPFEKFIAELMRAEGYETVTDQIVYGACVPHEVDVVAWNAKKLIMIEAKFHNEFGFKSDLKVALYIKARFDDLHNGRFNYGGNERPLDEGWLVTNTKFTEQAIIYGECQKLKMIGWNYPAQNNLHDMIERHGLHPFTCLSTLSNVHKKFLLDHGIILCRDIVEHQGLLREAGMDDSHIARVLGEIKETCGA